MTSNVLRSLAVFLFLTISLFSILLLSTPGLASAALVTFSDEATFVASTGASGPIDPPFTAQTTAPIIAGDLTITRGPGVSEFAVANIIGNSLASDLLVTGVSFSNLDIALATPFTAFGFTVDSFTRAGGVGASTFTVDLLLGSTLVGSASFTAPSVGEVFFGVSSTNAFDLVNIRETAGGPQNLSEFGGADDREFFGRFFVASGPINVAIDIKPGSDPNALNPRSKGVIPVAILTTDIFDAQSVDPSTVQFGPGGAGIGHRSVHLEDIDDDGDLDLVLHFRTQQTGIACGDTEASLTGQTFDGTPIEGSDSIATVGCK